jgi:tetratricopeptide (TPR) repeat protein
MRTLPRPILALALAVAAAQGPGPDLAKARQLYEKSEYAAAIRLLEGSAERMTPEAQALAGQSWYMLADFKRAVECFERAVKASPETARHHHWLGRAWGRRAATSNKLAAPVYAGHARRSFERAVELNPNDPAAVSDLFSYYLRAPGFLGGGLGKAEKLSEKLRLIDPAGYHSAQAQAAIARQRYEAAEGHLKRAVDLAPEDIGRIVDLASFHARRGRWTESEAAFEAAAKIGPDDKRLVFARAAAYVENRRNLGEAKRLLDLYLRSRLTPDDPSREEAARLLEKAAAAGSRAGRAPAALRYE